MRSIAHDRRWRIEMRFTNKARTALVALCCIVPAVAHGHGFAGKRFFPATFATDDPFVADELSLPTSQWQRFPAGDDAPAGSETDFCIVIDTATTENFGIEL